MSAALTLLVRCGRPLLVLALVVACAVLVAVTPVAAEKVVVVDVDGSIEDYAAITTILQHPDYSGKLRLVSVSGATWGYGPTAVRNLCRFLATTAAMTTATVALGAVAPAGDRYSSHQHWGSCAEQQGFPATPHDAALRGLPYSRADVTSAYGQTYSLPHIKTTSAACNYAIGSATNVFLTLLRQTDAERDTIVYLQLGSATNLAALAAAVQSAGSPSLLSKFYAVMEIHAFETGYSGGADNTSMAEVLGGYNDYSLRVRLYPPVFYNPGVTFSFATWAEFGTIAGTASTAPAVTWLYVAWAQKKALLDGSGGAESSTAFFKERGPAASLVALCAMDASLTSLCQSYRRAAAALAVATGDKPTTSTAQQTVLAIAGNNMTLPFYYLVTVPTAGETSASRYVYDTPASSTVGSASNSLASAFWTRWFYVLRL